MSGSLVHTASYFRICSRRLLQHASLDTHSLHKLAYFETDRCHFFPRHSNLHGSRTVTTDASTSSSSTTTLENAEEQEKGERKASILFSESLKHSRARKIGIRKKRLAKIAKTKEEKDDKQKETSQTEWKDEWGPDTLTPKVEGNKSNIKKQSGRREPLQLAYTRRIEGIIPPRNKNEEVAVLEDLEDPFGVKSIAKLAHGLDRVLFNPGVHWMQDPRSRVYNFSPYLQDVPNVKDFAFEKVSTFVKSSQDNSLLELARSNGKKFGGSTSSLTGILSQIYFLISNNRPVNTSSLSSSFADLSKDFTPAQRMAACVTLQYRDGVYLFDSDKTDDDNTDLQILLFQGTMLESFLTTEKSRFEQLLRSCGTPEDDEKNKDGSAYRYAMSKDFVMRSQLDCQDSRLPGTGVFDIKTRAAIAIRLDSLNYKEGSGYLIRNLQGRYESFEREYYDLIRSAFLKYSFQVRIGNMDGVFVAYHNTAHIFGFQYIPLKEMDFCLFGGESRGEQVFSKCVRLLEELSNEIIGCFPDQTISCMVETSEETGIMHVWVQAEGGNATEDNRIIQLDVTTQSFINGRLAKDSAGTIVSPSHSWLLLWSIAHSALPQSVIKSNYDEAKRRRMQVYNIPTGVDPSDVEKLAASPDFGFGLEPPSEDGSETETRLLPEAMFQVATGSIVRLRTLARAGKADWEKMKEEERENGVRIWQQSPIDGV